MEWWAQLIVILGGLVVLMAAGIPVALAFFAVNTAAMVVLLGGFDALRQLILSMYSSVSIFALVPIPMFILMGEIMFHSGVAFKMMDALDNWIGKVPGRLSLLAVAGGTLFATLSGSSVASTAMLGSILVPRMREQGYSQGMAIGPILGSGTLAAMIPPTALGVLLASLAQISVGDFLLAIVVPGLVMALAFAAYIIVRCALRPDIAPRYDLPPVPLRRKMAHTFKYILPLGTIIFLVIGLIVLGVATPNEAAALGALGSFVLAFVYNKGVKWQIVKKSLIGTLNVTGMIMLILAGSTAFSQLLAFTGATAELVRVVTALSLPPIGIVVLMMAVLIVMGMFMEPLSILMISLPLMIPVVRSLGINDIWFGTLVLLNMEMAAITPPFGMSLFVMKGLLPGNVPMFDVYKASYAFFAIDILVMALLILFPQLVLWLPGIGK
ncbi:MAG: TRAP transporter large permease subunit [Thermoleophilia bacterium]